jgi:hypothetical protein
MKSRLPNDRSPIRTAFVVIILLWLAAWWLTGAETRRGATHQSSSII